MTLKGVKQHKINNIEENNEVRALQLHHYVIKVDITQKHKIDNIEENNGVIVLKLHQYVIQVGRRQKQ